MSYTNKTKHLKLPQWELSDKPDMHDFNHAFSNIDEMSEVLNDSIKTIEEMSRTLNNSIEAIDKMSEELNVSIETKIEQGIRTMSETLNNSIEAKIGQGIRTWSQRLKTNNTTPVRLTQPNGQDLDPAYTYRISARTTGTSIVTWYTAVVGKMPKSSDFLILQESCLAQNLNHPRVIIKDNNPYICLWAHEQFYTVSLTIEQLPLQM